MLYIIFELPGASSNCTVLFETTLVHSNWYLQFSCFCFVFFVDSVQDRSSTLRMRDFDMERDLGLRLVSSNYDFMDVKYDQLQFRNEKEEWITLTDVSSTSTDERDHTFLLIYILQWYHSYPFPYQHQQLVELETLVLAEYEELDTDRVDRAYVRFGDYIERAKDDFYCVRSELEIDYVARTYRARTTTDTLTRLFYKTQEDLSMIVQLQSSILGTVSMYGIMNELDLFAKRMNRIVSSLDRIGQVSAEHEREFALIEFRIRSVKRVVTSYSEYYIDSQGRVCVQKGIEADEDFHNIRGLMGAFREQIHRFEIDFDMDSTAETESESEEEDEDTQVETQAKINKDYEIALQRLGAR
jgi:hypothetical protein